MGFLAVIIILIVGIVFLFTRDSGRDNNLPAEQRVDTTEYISEPSVVTYITEGRLNAEEEHRSIRISISRNVRSLDVLGGYNGTILRTNSFPNTQSAYDEFMHALDKAGFTRKQKAVYSSEKGVCPLGRRYIYRLDGLGEEVSRLWSTSCSNKEGSFAGNASLIRQLFENQIPEYYKLTSDVSL